MMDPNGYKAIERVNMELAKEMLSVLPENKKQILMKALDRNLYLTSSRVLGNGTFTVYKEGFYLELEGARTSFSVFAYDNDGEFVFARKPKESKLHRLYKSEGMRFCEADFMEI